MTYRDAICRVFGEEACLPDESLTVAEVVKHISNKGYISKNHRPLQANVNKELGRMVKRGTLEIDWTKQGPQCGRKFKIAERE